ncbi:uncharacterized protein PHACADRAFT_107991 [Phanerochaete carnosa HHB-10118-sp]|uniref:CxC1-like cysteine cluster associated with KDZ transposases domain-containing protein n=1 Tax=Phanerochaete carnosa (strain HHB-10118-sp) TaxID=650164 RepID=K5VQR1_PHACS|nr:uncharacterized protein PHACADRAFT_107991 [Phanerochaete carnosa HHB-10118-sp]EKM48904.1 hypothetical protein PHACADRAFT_107991 [Phanerochaete carnosa HHB-10118-sp]
MREEAAWSPLLDALADRFLRWKYPASNSPPECSPSRAESTAPRSTETHFTLIDDTHARSPQPIDKSVRLPYCIKTYDIFTLQNEITVFRPADSTSPALDLLEHGYIAKTPGRPEVAVSVKTLDLLYRLRQRKASFSIEAFAKVVCDYYMIPYREYLRKVFSDTFEVYLRITRIVEKRLHAILRWDAPDWRPLNACRACCYKLKDEPPLSFSRLWSLDGNNSLKRMATADWEDVDELEGDPTDGVALALLEESTKRTQADDSNEHIDIAMATPASDSVAPVGNAGDSTAPAGDTTIIDKVQAALLHKLLDQCVDNWKAAAAEAKKKMWKMYEESGVFASACRHGFILWLCDMVRSGELAKYPLAIVAKALETMPDEWLAGYDIGCSAEITVKNSSLGPEYVKKHARMCVNAFHGYSHSHICQLRFHPNVIEGAGIEDFETMERVFSRSNDLAPVIRYASAYRRRLLIEAFLKQWDADKYLNSGDFILDNYTQALEIVDIEGQTLRQSMEQQGITAGDITRWRDEELAYFATLGDELDYDIHSTLYVELLQKLRDLEPKLKRTQTTFLSHAPSAEKQAYSRDVTRTRKLETERRVAAEQYDRVSAEVVALEIKMDIQERWDPTTPAYQEALKYICERTYRRALDKLHRLVVQRLFELQKLNMRTHIAKSLQVRSKTIKKAVADYNAVAVTMNPPRPTLDWSEVTHYAFLEEFSLLQDTRNDVRQKPWAQPITRETIKMYRRVARANEELERLNIEVRRLHTAIIDEDKLLRAALASLGCSHQLYGAMQDFALRRQAVNNHLLRRVFQVYDLPGYTGTQGSGEAEVDMVSQARLSSVQLTVDKIPPLLTRPDDVCGTGGDISDDENDENDDEGSEEAQGNVAAVVEYIAGLSIV